MAMYPKIPTQPTPPIRVLLVDDHTLVRQGIRRILEPEPDVIVVGEASDGNEALRLVEALHPDVVLMDISMPHRSGLDATLQIRRQAPRTRILLLTMHEGPLLQEEAQRIGASGYLVKRSADRELLEAIRQVYRGRRFFPKNPQASRELHSCQCHPATYHELSQREREILGLLAQGMTNREIARYFCISVNTVETHRKNLMRKLNLHSLSDIIKYALAHGLIQP